MEMGHADSYIPAPCLVVNGSSRLRGNCVILPRCWPPLRSGEFKMTPLKALATYDDFARLDIRIGRVVEVQPFPRARNPSYKVGVDVGAGCIMWSSAQITSYQPDEL